MKPRQTPSSDFPPPPHDRILSTVAVPPDGRLQIVCQNFPECMCGEDCIDRTPAESLVALWVLFGLMIYGGVAFSIGLLAAIFT